MGDQSVEVELAAPGLEVLCSNFDLGLLSSIVKTAERNAGSRRVLLYCIEVSFGHNRLQRKASVALFAGRLDFPDGKFTLLPTDYLVGVGGGVANHEISRS